jgi:hypothetical protein
VTHFAHILAKSNSGGLVVGLIVVAFWVLSALSNWMKKLQEAEKRRRVRETISQANAMSPEAAQKNLPRAKPPWRPPAQAQRKAPPAKAPVKLAPMRVVQQPRAQPPKPQRAQQVRRAAVRQPTGMSRTAPASVAVVPSRPPPLPAVKQDIAATEIRSPGAGAAAAARPLSATAATLNRWLRPSTLRQQFMLTEVLQPPLALRPDRL